MRTRILAALLLMAVPAARAEASELGNIFGSPAAELQSSRASARALEGLESILAALRARELREPGAGRERLSAASTALRQASAAMREVVIPEQQNRPITTLNLRQAELQSLAFAAQRLRRPPIANLRELYQVFAETAAQLADLAERQMGAADDDAILFQLGPEFTFFIRLGEVVTRVSRAARAANR